MSRLAGRVTFHNNSDDDRQESSSTWKNDSRSGKGRNEAQFRQPQKPRSEDCDFDQPRIAYGGGKPRGRGPNYGKAEKAVYQPPRRYENNDRYEKSDRQERFKRQEKPEQSERFEDQRKPTAKVEDVVPSEELLDFEDIITQISDLSVRSDRSALQISECFFVAISGR
uniref:Uncharacterized protein n=1 Tax=Caenorhabditis japonica TaxID=281687 RepID=A0A8R1I913_CAEJA